MAELSVSKPDVKDVMYKVGDSFMTEAYVDAYLANRKKAKDQAYARWVAPIDEEIAMWEKVKADVIKLKIA